MRTCDNAINSCCDAQFRQPQNVIVDLIGDASFAQCLLACAGQYRDTQDRHVVLSASNRRPNHLLAAAQMNRQHLHAKPMGRFHRLSHRVWDVMQFQIQKNFRAGSKNSAHNLRTPGGVKLQADFKKADCGR